MKAQVLGAPAPIESRPLLETEVERPRPAAGEALVRVHACGVCRTDLHVCEGDLPVRRSSIIPGHQIVGTVLEINDDADAPTDISTGDRVGIAWLSGTCGHCRYCRRGDENLCNAARFTGWTAHGGFAEYAVAPYQYLYRLPETMDDLQVAPLLCAGIIGYRCLRQCEIDDWSGATLGLYGFGAAGHLALQVAVARGADVFVCTRDVPRHQALAAELGATWVGGATDQPPIALDASIIFAPAGELVPPALRGLDRGGRLVLGGIHMSPIPELAYADLYWERVVRTVANNTRNDGIEFIAEAARIGLRTHTEIFELAEANDALIALKHDAIRGAAVLTVG